MEDQTIPGWRAWPRALPEKTPAQLLHSSVEVVEEVPQEVPQEPLLRPMIVDSVIVEVPDVPVKETKQVSKETLVREDREAVVDDVLVIKLKWSYVAYGLLGLLFVQMIYQFHSMSSRILILETTLRQVQK